MPQQNAGNHVAQLSFRPSTQTLIRKSDPGAAVACARQCSVRSASRVTEQSGLSLVHADSAAQNNIPPSDFR